jgi:hypothetical protein
MAALSPIERPVEPDPPEALAELEGEVVDPWVVVGVEKRLVSVGWVEGVGLGEVEGDEAVIALSDVCTEGIDVVDSAQKNS